MLPRIGKLSLGEKRVSSKTGKEYPAEVPHFALQGITELDRKRFIEAYGDEATEVEIVFHSDKIEDVFSQRYALYSGAGGGKQGRVKCSSNGETARLVLQNGNHEQRDCPQSTWPTDHPMCPGCPDMLQKTKSGDTVIGQDGLPVRACKLEARLTFLLPRVNLTGVFQLTTGGESYADAIDDSLRMLHMSTGGKLAGLPFILRRVPRVYADGKTHHPVIIEASHTLAHLITERTAHRLAWEFGRVVGGDKDVIANVGTCLLDNRLAEQVDDPQPRQLPQPTQDKQLHESVDPQAVAHIREAAGKPAYKEIVRVLGEYAMVKKLDNEARRTIRAFFHKWIGERFGVDLGVIDTDMVYRIPADKVEAVRSDVVNHYERTGMMPWEFVQFDDTITDEDLS